MLNFAEPQAVYRRCEGCGTLTRVDLLDDKGTDTLGPCCYGQGWAPMRQSWACMAVPAHSKEG